MHACILQSFLRQMRLWLTGDRRNCRPRSYIGLDAAARPRFGKPIRTMRAILAYCKYEQLIACKQTQIGACTEKAV